MINVPRARAAIAAVNGDRLVYSKAQIEQLLAEVEEGQRAKQEAAQLRAAAGTAPTAVAA